MTRKRFIKLCMSIGYSKHEVKHFIMAFQEHFHRYGYVYNDTYSGFYERIKEWTKAGLIYSGSWYLLK